MADTKYPHQDLLHDNKIEVSALPQKTQDLITKFGTLTDDDAKDALDEKLYGLIEDHMEDIKEKEKAAKTKAKVAAHKEKKAEEKKKPTPAKSKIDVKNAETATGDDDDDEPGASKKPTKKDDKQPTSRGVLRTIFGH